MAEIYRDSTGKGISLDIPGAVVTDVKFFRNGVVIGTPSIAASPVLVPYVITHVDGEFTVSWTYTIEGNEYNRRDSHEVVTPLFTNQELVEFNATFAPLTSGKVAELERLIRGIIQGYCNQKFGSESGEIKAWGNGNTILMSPRRIISIDGIDSGGIGYPYAYRPVKAGFGIERVIGDSLFTSVGPIMSPYNFADGSLFRSNTSYTIRGTFGWESVPTDIKQAALLLAESFSCREASWRDRYLKAVAAADWRFDFDSRAFVGTGSVSVDQLLNQYVVGGVAVI